MMTVEQLSPLLQAQPEGKLLVTGEQQQLPGLLRSRVNGQNVPKKAPAGAEASVSEDAATTDLDGLTNMDDVDPLGEDDAGNGNTASRPQAHGRRGLATVLQNYVNGFFHLFFNKKFRTHRVFGLCYLLQWTAALVYYLIDYETFKDSFLVWSLPLSGIIQSMTAIRTFTFLPKKAVDPGYFSDKITMSYPFIVENSFFATILLFQWLYYNDRFYGAIRKSVVPETVFVFLPYVIRNLWPKTSFRDSLAHPKYKTHRNQIFYYYAVNVTKSFYVWAKHYIGYFLNYVRFLRRDTDVQKYYIYHLLLFSAFATTVSVFLHTLKFKKYIGPRLSFFIYSSSYLATFYGFLHITDVFTDNLDLVVLVLGGLLLNFRRRCWQYAYQILMLAALYAIRFRQLPHWAEPFFAALGHPGGY